MVCLFFSAGARGQSATDGAIGGTVADTGGALLPGTTITVTNVENGVSRTVKSNSKGEYQVPELHPGTYSISFSADGFDTYQETNVLVTVGSVSNVSPKLKVGSVANKVEVTDETPIMHVDEPAISTTIDQALIDNLPMNGRRWSDFARLTPGVVSNLQGFGLLSFRGISYLLNNNTVDGADDNQAYYSEARGRTRTAYSISPAAVQEFQVNTSNYSAQYGRAAGGVINTVTKSGTNTMHGELFFYDRDVDLGGASNPYTLLTVEQPNGVYTSVPTKPTDWRKQWGFGVGGPIIKDKLFWFYTYDQERRNFPGISRPTDPNDLFAPTNSTLPANETCTMPTGTATSGTFTTTQITYSAEGDYNSCLLATLFGVPYEAGAAYYQQGLGLLQSFIGIVPRKQDQVVNLPKIDYQINERNHLALLYNRMRYSSPFGLYSQTNDTQGASGWGDDNVKEDFGIARLSTVINNTMVNEALVQYGRDFEFDYQDPPLPNELPMAHNSFGRAPGTNIGYEFSGGFYIGANPDLTRYADPDERRLQLLDGVTWSHGRHTTKFGLEYNKVSDYDNYLYNGNGSYSYDWTYTFIADYLNLTTGLGGPVNNTAASNCTGAGKCYNQLYYDYSQAFGNPIGLITTREYAGYVTDDWRILPNLTLTLGVRYEYEYVPPPISPNPALNGNANGITYNAYSPIPNTYNQPDYRFDIGPRTGFSWDIYGTGRTILRGGFGIYYGRIINSNILATYQESGGPNAQVSVSTLHPPSYVSGSVVGCGPQFPNLTTYSAFLACNAANGYNDNSSVAFFDPKMRPPQVEETDLAIEQNLGHNTVLGITYMGSFGHNLPGAVDVNYNPGSFVTVPWAIATTAASSQGYSFSTSTNSEAPTTLSAFPVPSGANAVGYTVQPHGGKLPPLPANGQYSAKMFITSNNGKAARPNTSYYQIIDVKSWVNSNYNALAAQLEHRFESGFSLLTNITWSHALDENPYESTGVASYNMIDPTNLRAEYGNSSTDVRLRYVGALIYEPHSHFHGAAHYALDGWRISPLVQAQTGLPFTPGVSVSGLTSINVTPAQYAGCTPAAGATTCSETLSGSGVNGSGSSAGRLPFLDRNTYTYPKTAVFDMRLSKYFDLPGLHFVEHPRLEILTELFNVMNHQNITGVTTEAYTLTSTGGVPTLSPYSNFGTYTNSNSNYTYSSRQLQLAARLHF